MKKRTDREQMYKNVDTKMLIQRTVQNNVQFVFGYRNLSPHLVAHKELRYFDNEKSEVKR